MKLSEVAKSDETEATSRPRPQLVVAQAPNYVVGVSQVVLRQQTGQLRGQITVLVRSALLSHCCEQVGVSEEATTL